MRLLLTSLAAVVAVAFAAPSFAQETTQATPTPTAKPKPGTTAYCNTLKTPTSRSACLKRVHAQATPKATPVPKAKPKKIDAPSATPKSDNSAHLAPPAASPSPPQTISVPPLPQKTI